MRNRIFFLFLNFTVSVFFVNCVALRLVRRRRLRRIATPEGNTPGGLYAFWSLRPIYKKKNLSYPYYPKSKKTWGRFEQA